MKRTVGIASVVTAVGLYAACASAAQPVGPYIGALVGETKLYDRETVDDTELVLDEKQFTWGAFAGYQFTQYLGAEVGYNKPRRLNLIRSDDGDRVSFSTSAWTASVVGTIPLGNVWSLHARAGAARLKATVGVRWDGASDSFSDSTTEAVYGGGVGAIFEGARVRLDYQRVNADGSRLSLLSLGIVWFLPTSR
jgi:hypothetical protein